MSNTEKQYTQPTLFGDSKVKQEAALRIRVNGEKLLSKNQQLFNKLSARVENLEKEIGKEDNRLSQVLLQFSKEIKPLHTQIAELKIELAMTLGKATELNKFTKKQTTARFYTNFNFIGFRNGNRIAPAQMVLVNGSITFDIHYKEVVLLFETIVLKGRISGGAKARNIGLLVNP